MNLQVISREYATAMLKTQFVYAVKERLWHHNPQFASHSYAVENSLGIVHSSAQSHLAKELLVHCDFVRMGVKMPFSQFDGFAYHYTYDGAAETEFVGSFETLADEVAVMYNSQ